MTGLDEVRDELIEVAAIVTDFELNPLDDGIDIVIKPSADARANMNEFVTNMHTTSGLITELDAGTTVTEAQTRVLEYVKKHVPEAGKAPLGGNSVGTDKVFLTKQMPELVEYLHYRIIDVSSIKELSKQWFPRAYFQAPAKHGGHRALGDIIDSIIELQYYRKAVFSAEGPSSDEAKSIAAEVAENYPKQTDES
ncbi:oligoribonuclease [Brevibacterium iodinum ATCC 49514]|uniref:Oligoribonuclease n=1 Tax=Brevibacterium iodinum ATCC 49514 TaxID=1255616 RepID=A0A2H1IC06_9MICO|nr:oligoribonuclease [Brevibacterium iodinum ATCC 49514]SUW13159.1 Oligoribonuclease [Brevibacterium iodinum]